MRVLIAVDGSEPSRQALRWAADLLRDRQPLEVTLVHCLPTLSGELFVGADVVQRFVEETERWGQSILDAAQEMLRCHGIESRPVLRRGQAGPAVVALAQQLQADLVFMGRRGLGRVQAALLGSTSSYVLSHWQGPVLVAH